MGTLEDKITEILGWLDANQSAEKEEYEEKQKELEGVALPILQAMGGGAMPPGGMPGGGMPDMGGSAGPAAPPASEPAGSQPLRRSTKGYYATVLNNLLV